MDTVVVATEVGKGYLKALGNKQGEHALACELIGSSMAEWLGLPTLEFTVFEVPAGSVIWLEDDSMQPTARSRRAQPGPAFLTRAIEADAWDGAAASLAKLTNPEMIAGLVLLDTWIGNPDRHPRRPADASLSTWKNQNLDNVMLAHLPKDRRRLVAMDFSVCLYCRGGGLRASYEDRLVRDEGIYGLFPAFEQFVTEARVRPFLDRLGDAGSLRQHLDVVAARIPYQWQVEPGTRRAVAQFLSGRARWLVDNFLANLQRVVPRPAE